MFTLPMSSSCRVMETVLSYVWVESLVFPRDSVNPFSVVQSSKLVRNTMAIALSRSIIKSSVFVSDTSILAVVVMESVTVDVQLVVNGELDPKVMYLVLSFKYPKSESGPVLSSFCPGIS